MGEDRLSDVLSSSEVEQHRWLGRVGQRQPSAVYHSIRLKALASLLERGIVLLGRQGQISSGLSGLEGPHQLRPQFLARAFQGYRVVPVENRLLRPIREVVENRAQPAFEKAGKQGLHAEGGDALADLLQSLADSRGRGGHSFSGGTHRGLGGSARGFREEQLSDRDEIQLLELLHRSLGLRVERANRLDAIPEEINSSWPGIQRGEDVQDAASNRECAHVLDQRRGQVAHIGEAPDERIAVELLTQSDKLGQLVQHRGRQNFAVQATQRQNQRGKSGTLPQMEQSGEPFGGDGWLRGEVVVGEDLVTGQSEDARLEKRAAPAKEKRQVSGEMIRGVLVGGDADKRCGELPG